ncbi:MAG: hypothetical protein HY327_06430 [Chloroflexi bacterium]|nr:hypothetical protein [Chloroflexota bacterium]
MFSQKYRADAIALAAYFILAILLTFPLILNFTTHVPGDGSDDPALAWNLWWVPHAIINLNISPIYTDYLFYPIGLNLSYYTLTYLNAFLSIPFQYAINLIVAANVNVLFSFAVGGFGAYLLVKYLLQREGRGQDPPLQTLSAFAAGALYAFSSNKMLYAALGQFNIASTQWIPFYVLFLLKTTDSRRQTTDTRASVRLGGLLGLFLLLQSLSEFIHASFLIIFTAIYLIYWVIHTRRVADTWKHWATTRVAPTIFALAIAALVFLIPMAPILVAQISDLQTEGDFFQRGLGFANVFSTDALGLFVPSQLHPLFGNLQAQFHFAYTNFAYLGYAAIFCALIALWRVPRSRIWGLGFGILLLLSFGPILRVNGAPVLDSPLLPFNWLLEIPFIKGNRYPSRWSVMTTLALAVMVGYGLMWVFSWVAGRKPQVARSLFATGYLGLVTLLLFEHLSIPLPLSNLETPKLYHTIAADRSDFSVLEVPLAWRNGFRMTGTLDQAMMFAQFYQTIHQHPILGGNTSRNPEFKFQYFTEMPVINSLIAAETGHTLDDATRARDQELAAQVLRFFGVQYVVWHSPRAPDNRPTLDAARAYIENILPVTKFTDVTDEQGDITGYRVTTTASLPAQIRPSDPLARMYFGEGWGALGEKIWATRREAKIFWRMDAPRDATFSFRAFAPMPNQRVVVRVNARDACAMQMQMGWSEYKCQVAGDKPFLSGVEGWQAGMSAIIFRFDSLVPVANVREAGFEIGKTGITSPASIVAYSAGSEVGDSAHIFVNGVDASPNSRGYNLVVLNAQTGAVEARAAFDTFASAAESARLAQFIAQIPDGKIVAVAVRDEASRSLTGEAVSALQSIGAMQDLRGKFRWSYAIIGVKGAANGTANEYANEVMPAQIVVGIGAMEPNVAAAVEWIAVR